MAIFSPAFVRLDRSYVMPESIIQFSQASGAFDALASGDLMVRLGSEDLAVYIDRVDLRTQIAAGQSAYNSLPSVSVTVEQGSTATYLMRVGADYDHHDAATAAIRNLPITETYRLGMHQAHFQQARNALLYGFRPEMGEGLLNTVGANRTTLPADSQGNTTLTRYVAGDLAEFLLSTVQAVKTATMQMGQGVHISVIGPQRALGPFEYQKIVALTSYQMPGGGVSSAKGMLQNILEANGDTLGWQYDDTLIGQGENGTDAILIVMPEVKKPRIANRLNTNEFAELAPSLSAATLQLCDMAAPREITSPLPRGAVDMLTEWRITSGWAVRPECVSIISAPYE